MNKRWTLMLLTGLLIIILLATGSSVYGQSSETIDTRIKILCDEYSFRLEGELKNAPLVLTAGERVEITFENFGFEIHTIHLGTGILFDGDKPIGYEENFLQDVRIRVKGGPGGKRFDIETTGLVQLRLDPEVEVTLEFTVPGDKLGKWQLGCFVKGHFDTGMHADLLVNISGSK